MFAARLLSLVVFLATPVMAADQSWDGRWVGKLDTDRGQATGFRVVVRFIGNEIKVYRYRGIKVSRGISSVSPQHVWFGVRGSGVVTLRRTDGETAQFVYEHPATGKSTSTLKRERATDVIRSSLR
jgi:hypothetical protein